MLVLLALIGLSAFLEWRYSRAVALLDAPWREVLLRVCEIEGGEVEKGVQRPFRVYGEIEDGGVVYGIPALALMPQVAERALIEHAEALRERERAPVAYIVDGFPGKVSLVPKGAYSRFRLAVPSRFMWAITLAYAYLWWVG